MKQKGQSVKRKQRSIDKKKKNKDDRIFGDKLNTSSKSNKITRVMFQNIHGFGYSKKQKKTEEIRSMIQESKVDIFWQKSI